MLIQNLYLTNCLKCAFDILLLIFVRYIKRNRLDAGYPLFETESLKWPGFVEFDDVNGKVLTYSSQDGWANFSSASSNYHLAHYVNLIYISQYFCSIYKVFDLKNYSFLYAISDKNVQEIKIRLTFFYFFHCSWCCNFNLELA